jgi:2-keto-4-pentenoate hydratase/2-oxohepta-3-ene-1,7-dioic acid hydratase in catechol pathway
VTTQNTSPIAGILTDDVIRAVPNHLCGLDTMAILRTWQTSEPVLREIGLSIPVDALEIVEDAQVVAPLTYPPKILGTGANYTDHAAEMGTIRPEPDSRAFFFLKPPTTSVVGTGAVVELPQTPGPRVDWEVELGVVIGHGGRHIPAGAALDHVAAFTVANDVSARGDFENPDAVAPVFAFDWLAHKGQDGFSPLGPGIVPHWLITNPSNLKMNLWVNGELMQSSSTANMIIDIAGLISAASHWVSLEPGDVILTGTPAGVGAGRGRFLAQGDTVRAQIEGIGELVNTIGGPS